MNWLKAIACFVIFFGCVLEFGVLIDDIKVTDVSAAINRPERNTSRELVSWVGLAGLIAISGVAYYGNKASKF